MTILVLDIAADSGGALTVLKNFYNNFLKDTDNKYILVTGVVDLHSCKNVTVVKLPWTKKSWFHRLYFDFIYVHKLIKKYDVNSIFSLQNTCVLNSKIPQTLYVHQPLPFCGIHFQFKKYPKFWIYQNLIGRLIILSVKKSEKVIVQTKWMKDAVIEKSGVNEEKISLDPPKINFEIEKSFLPKMYKNEFFYPASNYAYKNHDVIFEAMKLLKKEGISDYKVVLTLTYDELSDVCRKKYEEVKENVEFVGHVDLQTVYSYYTRTVLLFPSYIETYGLPLQEASMTGSPIIAASTPFAHEILFAYDDVKFFDFDDASKLADLMKEKII